MARKVIAVDLDDVLGDENGAMIRFINTTYGANHTEEDYYNADAPYGNFWEKVWNVSEKEARQRYLEFKKQGHKYNQKPLPGAAEALHKLKEHFSIMIITARGEDSVPHTQPWLEKHYPDIFDDVHFVPLWRDGKVTKAQIGKELKAEYLIDDNIDHCSQAAELGIKSLLFGNYGWNKTQNLPDGVFRVLDWQAVEKYFENERNKLSK